jgi:DNA-binding Lrp family transcriptional regulator
MPKSSKEQIADGDKKIIVEYKNHVKQSIDNIAKKSGYSKQKVWKTIKKLEENKTIWGYHAVIDDEKIKTKRYVMLIKSGSPQLGEPIKKITDLTLHAKGKEAEIEILDGGYLHGSYDWIMIFTAKDLKNVKKFEDIVAKEYHPFINKIEVMEYIFPIKQCGIVNPDIDKLKELFD